MGVALEVLCEFCEQLLVIDDTLYIRLYVCLCEAKNFNVLIDTPLELAI